jgi:hypothetical protein
MQPGPFYFNAKRDNLSKNSMMNSFKKDDQLKAAATDLGLK